MTNSLNHMNSSRIECVICHIYISTCTYKPVHHKLLWKQLWVNLYQIENRFQIDYRIAEKIGRSPRISQNKNIGIWWFGTVLSYM